MNDRRVHARLADDREIVRYEKAGKWYIETKDRRRRISLNEAARVAAAPDAEIRFGLPGGSRFDDLVVSARDQPLIITEAQVAATYARFGGPWRSWDDDTLKRAIESNESEATRLMSQADGMRRVLIERGVLPDLGVGDGRSVTPARDGQAP